MKSYARMLMQPIGLVNNRRTRENWDKIDWGRECVVIGGDDRDSFEDPYNRRVREKIEGGGSHGTYVPRRV